ncbi:MAG: branched-chain amino acid transport system ATP-binding protein [Clostridiales bacterium]|jgi:branched-chain amino acid transport system ATP-binding protein|nr:branched-chain amino acid transport system ATP-binding protein [Clostridiales bacterium]MDN5299355.1 branched-chain amino acid transport system ATP-binding protein [Clostridiales bacterium]
MMNSVLKVENLSISFGGLKAVDDLSFEIGDKMIYGLIGPNGAGKTTVFNCITKFYTPNSGKVTFKTNTGELINLLDHSVHQIINYGLARTFQNVELINDLSIIDNLLIGAHSQFKTSTLQQAFLTPRARREEKEHRGRAMDILNQLGLADKANEIAGSQPYGVLKNVELARTLMSRPKLIIIDEPAAGLNETETEALAEMIKKIRDYYHCAILMVEHDMGLVMGTCERICAINFGKKLAEGTPDEIKQNKEVQEAYLGKDDDDAEN